MGNWSYVYLVCSCRCDGQIHPTVSDRSRMNKAVGQCCWPENAAKRTSVPLS